MGSQPSRLQAGLSSHLGKGGPGPAIGKRLNLSISALLAGVYSGLKHIVFKEYSFEGVPSSGWRDSVETVRES